MEQGELIARGNTASVYLRGGRIVKVFDPRFAPGEAAREAEKQRLAYDAGLPVPRVWEVISAPGEQAILMDYVEGPTLGQLILEEPERADEYLGLSVALQRQMHQVRAGGLESMEEKLKRQILSAPDLSPPLRERALDALAAFSFPGRLCHGDFHAFNLIRGRDRIVILDWVDASAGHPHADVCRSYLLYRQMDEAFAGAYLRRYCRESEADPEAVLRWLPVIAAARMSEGLPGEQRDALRKMVEDAHF